MSEEFRARVADICRNLPGAKVSDPWGGGHDAWKVGGKMFALVGAVAPGVAIKCREVETTEMLKEAGAAETARYLHRSWVRLPEKTPAEELQARIALSYDLIRAGLPASVRKELAARGKE